MSTEDFEKAVFINCPFDSEYEPILQAILFCIIYLGFTPRIAFERADSGESRIDKIRELIEQSRFSIHDLSRCQAQHAGEHYRLNMPFELGIDYACRKYFGNGRDRKRILILEERPYRYQAAISDLAGSDIKHHNGEFGNAIKAVRNWLVSEGPLENVPAPSKIENAYMVDFQEWHFGRLLSQGWTDDEIKEYPTNELITSMTLWLNAGKPTEFHED